MLNSWICSNVSVSADYRWDVAAVSLYQHCIFCTGFYIGVCVFSDLAKHVIKYIEIIYSDSMHLGTWVYV